MTKKNTETDIYYSRDDFCDRLSNRESGLSAGASLSSRYHYRSTPYQRQVRCAKVRHVPFSKCGYAFLERECRDSSRNFWIVWKAFHDLIVP